MPCRPLGVSWQPFARSGWLRGRSFGDLGSLLGGSWSLLGSLGALLEPLGGVSGASWDALGNIWEGIWRPCSSLGCVLMRFAGILQNLEKQCNVLQKSRFVRTVIDGKMSLGGKLRPLLTPSWLVRVQVGAKRGIGRSQESSKSARDRPRAPQERPKSGQRAPKSATRVSRMVVRR